MTLAPDLRNATAYAELERRFARHGKLSDALGILQWDSSVMMPVGSGDARAEQAATIEVVLHEMLTDPQVGELLDRAAEEERLDDWQAANLREMRRMWVHANAVPADLVEAASKAVAKCELIWREARANDDFKALAPSLNEVLTLQRRTGEAIGAALGVGVYDALLDRFEPDGRSAKIDVLFERLGAFLPDLIESALARQAERPILPLDGTFPVDGQRALGEMLVKAIGFDFRAGRLDVSAHPFCGGASGDVRITTRYREDNFAPAMMGVMHETGHAVYEQNRPLAWRYQPVGLARGMSIHESQSLIVEMQAARSDEFLSWFAPLAREHFDGSGPAWEPENFRRLYTRVERGFIRVDADELTYPAHVILRYRLERAMIGGDLAIADLPQAWNEGMAELVGVTPPSDRLGCLQDIHWPSGGWGYFPTYTLGAMGAAQLFAAAKAADPAIPDALARGEFAPLTTWLKANVHEKASLLSTDDLMAQATGRALDVDAYRRHLETRYLR